MKITSRALLGTAAVVGILQVLPLQAALAAGAPTPAQLMQMIQQQQQQLDSLKAALEKAQAEAQAASAKAESAQKSAPDFLKSIEIGGAIEVEATNTEGFDDKDSSDITLSTVELYFDTQPTDFVSTHVQLIYEDDEDEDRIRLDEAFATLGNTEKFPLYLQAGKWAVPFGGFDTNMSSDPLTKDLGETKEAAVLVGAAFQGFSVEGYLYNGDTQRTGGGDNIDQFGLTVNYGGEFSGVDVGVGGGYISNIADSDGITDTLSNAAGIKDYVGGVEVHGSLGYEGFALLGGYMKATDSFQTGELDFGSQGAEPAAWNVEAAYTLPILGKETTFAATVQGTDEALALELPEKRYGGAITVGVMEHTAVTAEYLHDEDYGVSDGGTGKSGHTATLKLAVDF